MAEERQTAASGAIESQRMTQSEFDATVTSIDFRLALAKIANVIRLGVKTHRESWRDHDQAFHVAKAQNHLDRWESGDDAELCRLRPHDVV